MVRHFRAKTLQGGGGGVGVKGPVPAPPPPWRQAYTTYRKEKNTQLDNVFCYAHLPQKKITQITTYTIVPMAVTEADKAGLALERGVCSKHM